MSKSVGSDTTAIAPDASSERAEQELLRANRLFYDPLWADTRLVDPERFNTWPLVQTLIVCAPRRLEVAPGLRPRLPLADTQFIDISGAAVHKLRHRGASAAIGSEPRRFTGAGSISAKCARIKNQPAIQ